MAEEDISAVWRTWQVYLFGKRNVLVFELKESREGFRRNGRARSFHVEGPKTEKAQEPTVEILIRVIWSLRLSKAQRRVLEASGSILIVLNALVILFSIWNTSLVRKYEPDLTQKIPSRFTLTATPGLMDFIISWREHSMFVPRRLTAYRGGARNTGELGHVMITHYCRK